MQEKNAKLIFRAACRAGGKAAAAARFFTPALAKDLYI
jgi:hypothetical protein